MLFYNSYNITFLNARYLKLICGHLETETCAKTVNLRNIRKIKNKNKNMGWKENWGVTRREFGRNVLTAGTGIILTNAFAADAEAAAVRSDIAFISGCPELPLYARNEGVSIPPASLTKLMTVSLLLDEVESGRVSLDDEIPITDEARANTIRGGWNSPPHIKKLTVREALQMAMTLSYNDVAASIGQFVSGLEHNKEKIQDAGYNPGTEEAFAHVLMQEKAEKLGMKNTRFRNASGLPPHDTNIIIVGNAADYANV
jgi:beta-lactamase class A